MKQRRHIEPSRAICRPEMAEIQPPKAGMKVERANLTPLLRSANMVCVNCETCHLEFLKPVAWAKRVAKHYCSPSCTGIGKRRRKQVSCVVCGVQMLVTPSSNYTTCSKECNIKLKSNIDPFRQRDQHGQKYARRPLQEASGIAMSAQPGIGM